MFIKEQNIFIENKIGELDDGIKLHLLSSSQLPHGGRIKILDSSSKSIGCIPISYSNPKYFDSIKKSKVAIETGADEYKQADIIVAFSAVYHDDLSKFDKAAMSGDNVKASNIEKDIKDEWSKFYSANKKKNRSTLRRETNEFVRERRKELGLIEDDFKDQDSLNKKMSK